MNKLRDELAAKDAEITDLKRQLAEANERWSYARDAADRAKRKLAEARKDTERLDWLEAHPASAEPRSYWYYGWNWRWMGHMFNSIRKAIDAAREGK